MEKQVLEALSDSPIKVAFPITEDLRDQAYDFIDSFRESDDKHGMIPELVEVVRALTTYGLEFYFLHPLRRSGVGSIGLKGVSMALNTGQKGVLAVASRLAKGMSDKELSTLIDFIESIIIEFEEA